MYIPSYNRLSTPYHRIFCFIRCTGNDSKENHTKKTKASTNAFPYLSLSLPLPPSIPPSLTLSPSPLPSPSFRDLQNKWPFEFVEWFSVTGSKKQLISSLKDYCRDTSNVVQPGSPGEHAVHSQSSEKVQRTGIFKRNDRNQLRPTSFSPRLDITLQHNIAILNGITQCLYCPNLLSLLS